MADLPSLLLGNIPSPGGIRSNDRDTYLISKEITVKLFMVLVYGGLNEDSSSTYGPYSSRSRAEDWAQEHVNDNQDEKAIVYEVQGDLIEYCEPDCEECGHPESDCCCCSDCHKAECQCESDDSDEQSPPAEEDIFA